MPPAACRTLGPVSPQKLEYLTSLKPQQLRRCRGYQPTLIQIPLSTDVRNWRIVLKNSSTASPLKY
jgi:hypothetical protein